MYQVVNGEKTSIGSSQSFKVKSLDNKVLPAKDLAELARFQSKVDQLAGLIYGTGDALGEIKDQLKYIKVAIIQLDDYEKLSQDIAKIENKIDAVRLKLNGDRTASRLDIDTPPSISNRLGLVGYESLSSSSGPTQTHIDGYNIALEEFKPVLAEVRVIINQDMKALNDALVKAGAPYTPGALPEIGKLDAQ